MKRSGINFSPAGEAVAGSEEIERKKRGRNRGVQETKSEETRSEEMPRENRDAAKPL